MSGEWTCSCPIGECKSAGSRGCYFGTAPTPEPSEVAETTAGEREPWHWADARLVDAPAEPDAGDASEVNRPAAWTIPADFCGGPVGDWIEVLRLDHLTEFVAAHEAAARADERERIAQAIEVLAPPPAMRCCDGLEMAASIARGDAR